MRKYKSRTPHVGAELDWGEVWFLAPDRQGV